MKNNLFKRVSKVNQNFDFAWKNFMHLKGKTFGPNIAPWSSSVRSSTIIINSPCRSWGERALALCIVLIIFMHLHMGMENCVETLGSFSCSFRSSQCCTHCNCRSSDNSWVTARILFWHFPARPSVLFFSTLSEMSHWAANCSKTFAGCARDWQSIIWPLNQPFFVSFKLNWISLRKITQDLGITGKHTGALLRLHKLTIRIHTWSPSSATARICCSSCVGKLLRLTVDFYVSVLRLHIEMKLCVSAAQHQAKRESELRDEEDQVWVPWAGLA